MTFKDVSDTLTLLTGLVLLIFIAGMGGAILLGVWTNKIDLARLISEPDGKASMSRLQLLVFTFVIALSLFFIVVGSGKFQFPTLSPEILLLLGISSSTTLVSKAIGSSVGTPPSKSPGPPPPSEDKVEGKAPEKGA